MIRITQPKSFLTRATAYEIENEQNGNKRSTLLTSVVEVILTFRLVNPDFLWAPRIHFSLNMDSQTHNFSSFLHFCGWYLMAPFKDWGILRSMFSSFSMSFIVDPLSAVIDMPGLSARVSKVPHVRVSSTSDIDPTYWYITYRSIGSTGNQKLNSTVVLVLTPSWSLHMQVWRCLNDYLTNINDGIYSRKPITKCS